MQTYADGVLKGLHLLDRLFDARILSRLPEALHVEGF